jgi:hypothetical protein
LHLSGEWYNRVIISKTLERLDGSEELRVTSGPAQLTAMTLDPRCGS